MLKSMNIHFKETVKTQMKTCKTHLIWVCTAYLQNILQIRFNLEILTCDPLILDWLQSLKQFFINVSYQILVASLTLMALF